MIIITLSSETTKNVNLISAINGGIDMWFSNVKKN